MIKLLEFDSYFLAKRGKQRIRVEKRHETKYEEVEIYLGELKVKSSENPKMAIFFN